MVAIVYPGFTADEPTAAGRALVTAVDAAAQRSLLGFDFLPADDSAVVHIAGAETVTGQKTFNQPLRIATPAVVGGSLWLGVVENGVDRFGYRDIDNGDLYIAAKAPLSRALRIIPSDSASGDVAFRSSGSAYAFRNHLGNYATVQASNLDNPTAALTLGNETYGAAVAGVLTAAAATFGGQVTISGALSLLSPYNPSPAYAAVFSGAGITAAYADFYITNNWSRVFVNGITGVSISSNGNATWIGGPLLLANNQPLQWIHGSNAYSVMFMDVNGDMQVPRTLQFQAGIMADRINNRVGNLVVGPEGSQSVILRTNGADRLTIDSVGSATFSGSSNPWTLANFVSASNNGSILISTPNANAFVGVRDIYPFISSGLRVENTSTATVFEVNRTTGNVTAQAATFGGAITASGSATGTAGLSDLVVFPSVGSFQNNWSDLELDVTNVLRIKHRGMLLSTNGNYTTLDLRAYNSAAKAISVVTYPEEVFSVTGAGNVKVCGEIRVNNQAGFIDPSFLNYNNTGDNYIRGNNNYVVGPTTFNGDVTISGALGPTTPTTLNLQAWGNNSWYRISTNFNYGQRDFAIECSNLSYTPISIRGSTKAITFDGSLTVLSGTRSVAINDATTNTGTDNVFISSQQGLPDTGITRTGYNNTCIGARYYNGAGLSLTSGAENALYGGGAGSALTAQSGNCFFGSISGGVGYYNVAMGLGAGFNSTGDSNIYFGYGTGQGVTESNKLRIGVGWASTTPTIFADLASRRVVIGSATDDGVNTLQVAGNIAVYSNVNSTTPAILDLMSWGNNGWWRLESNFNAGPADFRMVNINSGYVPLTARASTGTVTLGGTVIAPGSVMIGETTTYGSRLQVKANPGQVVAHFEGGALQSTAGGAAFGGVWTGACDYQFAASHARPTMVITGSVFDTTQAAFTVNNNSGVAKFTVMPTGNVVAAGTISSPVGANGTGERFGAGSASAQYSTVVGNNAGMYGSGEASALFGHRTSGVYRSVSVGYFAEAGWQGVAIGSDSSTQTLYGAGGVAVGNSSYAHEGSIALGSNAVTTAANQFVVGSSATRWTMPATGQRNSEVGNGSGSWQTGYREEYNAGGIRCGFYNATPIARQQINSGSATLAADLLVALNNLGLIQSL